LVIEGSSGLGKTALVAAATTLATECGMQVLSARGRSREQELPYGVVMQLLESGLREGRDGVPALALGTGAPPFVPEQNGSSAVDDLRGVYRMSLGAARAAPLALLIDDADYADAPSIEALLYLTERIADVPIALVLSAGMEALRGPSPLGDIARHPMTTRCPLDPLTLEGTERRLVKRWPTLATEAAGEIHHASGGNPFVVDVLARELADRGDGVSVLDIAPTILAEWALVRAADVDTDAPALLTAAAVLGPGCELRHVSALANVDLVAAGIVLDRLVELDILSHTAQVSFAQPAVGTAIRRAQPASERAERNLRAARLLAAEDADPERVARHLLGACRTGSAWSVDALCDAAAVALSRGAPTGAVLYLRRALEEPPPRPKRAHVVLELGRAEAAAGDPDAGLHLLAAVREPEQAIAEPLAALEAGRALVALGNPCDALEAFQHGLGTAPDADGELAAWLRASHATALWLTTRADAEAPPLPPVPETAATPGDRSLLALHAFVGTLHGAPATDVRALAERALARGALLEDETSAGLSYYLATFALAFGEALPTAEAALTAAIEDAQSRGSVLGFAIASRLRARAILMRGRLSDAAVDARRALAVELPDWELGRGAARTILSAVMLEQGDLERARHHLDQADAVGGPNDWHLVWLLSARGRLALYGGDAAAALEYFLRCGKIADSAGITNPAVVEWRAHAGQATATTGDRAEGRQLIQTELAQAQAFGAPGAVGRAMRALASVSDPATALETLEGAVEVLRPSQAALERAAAMVDFGAALRRAGKRRDALPMLREGLDLATRCGADALVNRAMDEASAAGARPRRTALHGREALTQRERQVALLAEDGRSNREIAQKLVVTVKTVEWHLGHTYAKLGVKSRRDLRGKLD
jgi:DNA-binding CsgD family transcriptional regulator